MQVSLIKIGNSKGIRLPKAIIEQTGMEDEIDLQVEDGKVVLSPTKQRRAGWAQAAKTCHQAGHDDLGDWDNTLNDGELS